ncbi:Peptidase family M23 [Cohnella sp. OV330]|uniref:murein hydrolase activator EnvC family protein n=1 Tax=Cohnella sp. OV330 TaxID=1855288 RepID=UPI0008EE09F3|nr:peptidoglycan DD-metalloendopeptidase family protein [Cohnella sp. OV330]SFB48204.1 Peptidase family M23 [Cohnella sp. OV330]
MNRRLIAVLVMLLGVVFLVRPYESHAETKMQKIERQLKEIQAQMNAAAENKKEAERRSEDLTNKKALAKTDMFTLLKQIQQTADQLDATQAKIDAAEAKLLKTTSELESAEASRQNRDEQLRDRIRLIYMNGSVSYLDVLLSSKSFSDFVGRFQSLQSIMEQDKEVLSQTESYKALVADKKAQVELDLTSVKKLYSDMADKKAELQDQEKEKEVLVASINQKIEETEDISEEAEAALMEFGKKYSKLLEQKKQLKTYYTGGKLGLPLKREYRLSSPFGYRTHPVTGQRNKLHTGMDMAVPEGTPVYAAESGTVIVAQSWSGYGNCIIINHGGGLWTLYGHLKPGGILVEKGETVKRGEKIGLVGMTGTATGYHLHFEVRKDGTPVNPAPYLK